MFLSSYLQVQVGYPDLPYFGASWAPVGSVWISELFVISDLSLYFSYTALCGELIAEHLIMTQQVCVGLNGDVEWGIVEDVLISSCEIDFQSYVSPLDILIMDSQG